MKFRYFSGTVLAAALATGPAFADHHGKSKSYDYGDRGPEVWGQLHGDYALCEKGDMQSPIDLANANAKGAIQLDVDYQPGGIEVLNKGLTIQANFPKGSSMTSGGMKFNLIQIHFHTPSEHAISGKRFPLTGHFVHATDDGKLGVLGVMFEEGAANKALDQILDVAPGQKSDQPMTQAEVVDPTDMLPADRSVYRYMGSLTTPPCSEGVNWHVLSKPITASKMQIAKFAALMGDSARPVRAVNNRLVVAPE
jgi:carbonic anhydrase